MKLCLPLCLLLSAKTESTFHFEAWYSAVLTKLRQDNTCRYSSFYNGLKPECTSVCTVCSHTAVVVQCVLFVCLFQHWTLCLKRINMLGFIFWLPVGETVECQEILWILSRVLVNIPVGTRDSFSFSIFYTHGTGKNVPSFSVSEIILLGNNWAEHLTPKKASPQFPTSSSTARMGAFATHGGPSLRSPSWLVIVI